MRQQDEFTRTWIIDNAIPIVENYGSTLTLRALHYRLVAQGMTNTLQHYKRVIGAMTKARWDGLVDFDAFVDHDRSVEGKTRAEPTYLDDEIQRAQEAIAEYFDADLHRSLMETQETEKVEYKVALQEFVNSL